MILEAVRRVKAANPQAQYVCDPVMGDSGAMFVKSEIVDAIRKRLAPAADIVTPNHWELETLVDTKLPTLETTHAGARLLRQARDRHLGAERAGRRRALCVSVGDMARGDAEDRQCTEGRGRSVHRALHCAARSGPERGHGARGGGGRHARRDRTLCARRRSAPRALSTRRKSSSTPTHGRPRRLTSPSVALRARPRLPLP